MKKLYNILFLLIVFSACRNNADYPFEGENAVYFQLNMNANTWNKTLDSLVYTFAGKGVDEYTFQVRVNLEGNTAKEARPVKVMIDEEKTTATAGLHYEMLKPEYELPGDSVYTYIPVTVYNKDKELENKAVVIALKLQASEMLGVGITERLGVRLIVSNTLKMPDYWESRLKYYFGTYSRRKHEICIEQLGVDFPETASGYDAERGMWMAYGKYMSNYFTDNYPVYDENQVPIEPW